MFLIKVMWIYTLFIVFASLTDFSFVFKSPVSGNELLITANKFQKDLLYFGQIYYLAKYLTSKKSINLLEASVRLLCLNKKDPATSIFAPASMLSFPVS